MVKGTTKTLEPPQGIGEIHIRTSRWARHASPGSILLIGALLITARNYGDSLLQLRCNYGDSLLNP